MTTKPQDKLASSRQQRIERLIGRMSTTNRAGLAKQLQEERNQGHRETSLYSSAIPVVHADKLLGGKAFLAATPGDFTSIIAAFRLIYSPQSLRVRVVNLRKHVRWLHETDRLPRSLERALYVRRERDLVVGQVISDAHFTRLLAAIETRASLAPQFPVEVRDRAIFTLLRSSGLRISELTYLNVGNITMEGSVVLIRMSPDAPDQKSGPRSIYVEKHLSELRAWLSVHPDASNRTAPLFVQAGCLPMQRLGATGVRKILRELGDRSGVHAELPAPLTPHDFRHTCATEKARLGWNESQLRMYFGWAPGSKTPSVYVHLSMDDQRARILKDAHDVAGQLRQHGDANVTAMAQLLQRLLEQATKERSVAATS